MQLFDLIDTLYDTQNLRREEFLFLLENLNQEARQYLYERAFERRLENYGRTVYFRGLIEISNYCRCDCAYCGIRKSNRSVERYRLTDQQILDSCQTGHELGFRTFVLQGGEDSHFNDERLIRLLSEIKHRYPECAITLSLGERSYDSYQQLYNAGADRYLLRHETATRDLYESLHPGMSFENRRRCLRDLREIGYQTGAGFLVGLPNQTTEDYVNDLLFLQELQPHMVGLGPFLPQKETPLREAQGGDSETTLLMLALVRLILPKVLLPATTALGTLDPMGREKAFRVGANVVMPNLSPFENRSKYALYDGKKFISDEAAEELKAIQLKISKAGFEPVMERGDHTAWKKQ